MDLLGLFSGQLRPLLGAPLLVVGAIMVVFGIVLALGNRRVLRWPTTAGRILSRGVAAVRQRSTPGKRATVRYQAAVTYTYTVDQREYTGQRVHPRRQLGSSGAAQALVDGLADPVPVRYNPEDPAEAVLLPNPAWVQVVLLVVGGLCLLLSLGSLLS
jgi:hypothetical protein